MNQFALYDLCKYKNICLELNYILHKCTYREKMIHVWARSWSSSIKPFSDVNLNIATHIIIYDSPSISLIRGILRLLKNNASSISKLKMNMYLICKIVGDLSVHMIKLFYKNDANDLSTSSMKYFKDNHNLFETLLNTNCLQ